MYAHSSALVVPIKINAISRYVEPRSSCGCLYPTTAFRIWEATLQHFLPGIDQRADPYAF